VEVVLDEFQGEIEQTVPLFSAVKVKGKRLYKSARSGEKVELPRRRVNIYTLELQSWDPPWLQLRVESGKGAYMRSLVNDLGNRLGCGALVQELRRLRVGEFRVEEAVSPRQLQDRAGFPWT
jgi:tRNA pseudouridine55 synthase